MRGIFLLHNIPGRVIQVLFFSLFYFTSTAQAIRQPSYLLAEPAANENRDSGSVTITLKVNGQGSFSLKNAQQFLHYSPTERSYIIDTSQTANGSDYQAKVNNMLEGTNMIIWHSAKTHFSTSTDSLNTLAGAALKPVTATGNKTDQKVSRQLCLKTIVQWGANTGSNSLQPTTLPLDIVPAQNLYNIGGNKITKVKFAVLFKGQPLASVPVQIDFIGTENKGQRFTSKTNAKGICVLKVTNTGLWILSADHIIPAKADTATSWLWYSGTLSWGKR